MYDQHVAYLATHEDQQINHVGYLATRYDHQDYDIKTCSWYGYSKSVKDNADQKEAGSDVMSLYRVHSTQHPPLVTIQLK